MNLLPRLNEEYPASQYSTAWTLEFGVPTRRVGNIGNEATPAPDQALSTNPGTIGADVRPNRKEKG
jgi:hypothetical protein